MRMAPRTPKAGEISVASTMGVGDGEAEAEAVGVGSVLVTLKMVGTTVVNGMPWLPE